MIHALEKNIFSLKYIYIYIHVTKIFGVHAHLHTRTELLVAKQQVAEGEICRLVLGPLPEPEAPALYNERHGNQLARVIYPRHVDEASVFVNLTDEVGSGLGKHGFWHTRAAGGWKTERERETSI